MMKRKPISGKKVREKLELEPIHVDDVLEAIRRLQETSAYETNEVRALAIQTAALMLSRFVHGETVVGNGVLRKSKAAR